MKSDEDDSTSPQSNASSLRSSDTDLLTEPPAVFTPSRSTRSPFQSPSLTPSTTFWQSSPETKTRWTPTRSHHKQVNLSVIRSRQVWTVAALLTATLMALLLFFPVNRSFSSHLTHGPNDNPMNVTSLRGLSGPEQWLMKHSNNAFMTDSSSRPKAAIISLVRNGELKGILQSMEQLELRWNHKYRYPWIFFSEETFTPEFRNLTSSLTTAPCYFETLPDAHWSIPDWVDKSRFMDSLDYLGTIGVGKGWMISYRNMCRWNSGFFYRHPRLREVDFYWRVEPDVHFFCDIDYDVFRFMRDNRLKYGFTMNILDDARSFPSLWSETRAFMDANPDLIHPESDIAWLVDAQGEYNNCQFFSNFEIGDLRFFRGQQNAEYFDWLDKSAGFYYERYGDAPIHTLSVALFMAKSEVWYFKDIGYQHDLTRHCPPANHHRCTCESTPMDENFYKLVPLESPQIKPLDTCLRQFLGGEYLKKKAGWTREAEMAIGGDGYHGYTIEL